MIFNTVQQGDVLLYQGDDGGEINVENGITEMTQLYDTFIYLILCGSNEDDNNTSETEREQYCGNEDEPAENKLRGKLNYLLKNRPINSETIREIRDAAADDITSGFGAMLKSVIVTVTLITTRHIELLNEIMLVDNTIIKNSTRLQI